MKMPKSKWATMARLCSAVLLSAGCTAAPTSPGPLPSAAESPTATAIPRPGTDDCRVTPPTEEGIPKELRDNYHGFFFGQGALWVTAWWVEEQTLDWVRENDRTKYGSFTIQDGMVTDELGPPRVEGTRLDGEGEASGGTGGYATSMGESGTTLNWWPTTIDFPSLGCWQITETVGDTSITYVVQL